MLDKLISNERYIATFEKPNTAPTAFDPQGTTLLSPHLHFGSLCIREFYWRVQDVVENYYGKPTQPPVSLTGQLLFRDMYFTAQAALGYSFGQTMTILTADSSHDISLTKSTTTTNLSLAHTTSIRYKPKNGFSGGSMAAQAFHGSMP